MFLVFFLQILVLQFINTHPVLQEEARNYQNNILSNYEQQRANAASSHQTPPRSFEKVDVYLSTPGKFDSSIIFNSDLDQ